MLSEIPKKSWCCDSEDVPNLPLTGVPNGQCVYTMDTHEVYMFSKSKAKWEKQ